MHLPQRTTGPRAKSRTISREEADQVPRNIEEKRIKLLKEASDLQNALYNFKFKSWEIQDKIQKDMDTVNLDIDMSIKSPNNLTEVKKLLLSNLVGLKFCLELVADNCKHQGLSYDLLQEFVSIKSRKIIAIKQASAMLKDRLMTRKKITDAISMLDNSACTDPSFGFSSPAYKNGTTVASEPTPASVISELNSMIIGFSTFVIKSKLENIHLETSKQTTTDPANEPIATPFGATNLDNVDPSSGVENTDTSITRKKLMVRAKKTPKKLPNTPVICTPPANELLDRIGTEFVRFRPLEIIELGDSDEPVTLNHQCITLMEQYECKSLEELRLTDYVWAARSGRQYSAVFALPQDQLNKIAFFYNTCEARAMFGTHFVKYEPTFGCDMIEDSSPFVNYICITAMRVFRFYKSLEELRLEDYFFSYRYSRSNTYSFSDAAALNAQWQSIAEFGRFKPRIDIEGIIKSPCENKSFEEIRLEDYKSGRNKAAAYVSPFPPQQVFGPKKATGPFKPTQDSYVRFIPRVAKDDDSDSSVNYQCITLMTEYENKSVEELRLIDYTKAASEGRKFVPVFALPQKQLRKIEFFYTTSLTAKLLSRPAQAKYIPFTGTDVIIKGKTSETITVVHQCITLMAEYINKSLEEIRLEDYVVNFSEKRKIKTKITRRAIRKRTGNTEIQKKQMTEQFTSPQAQKPTTQSNQSPECNSTPKTRETPTQKNQTPECTSTPKTRETPTQNNQAPECNSTPKTRETPTQNNQAPECNSTTKTQETPTQNNRTPECNSTPKIRETSTQNNQTPECNSTPKTRETRTQNDQTPECNSTSKTQETPTQNNRTPECSTPKTRETPTQNNRTPECNSTTKTQETPTQNNQAPECSSTPKTQETPTQNNQAPECSTPKTRETPTQNNRAPECNSTTKTPGPQSSLQTRETPINEIYENALEKANEALKLDPENPLKLTERSSAYLMLRDYKHALEDAQKAVAIDSTFITGYILIAKCCLKLGGIVSVEQAVKRGTDLLVKLRGSKPNYESKYATDHRSMLELGTRLNELRRYQEQSRKLLDQQRYYSALELINTCLDNYCPACYKTKLLKAECLANIGKYQEAQDIAINLAIFERYDAEAIYVVGLCLYNQGKEEKALEHFRMVNNLDPDNKKAARMYKITKERYTSKLLQQKKDEGNRAFKNGHFEDALELYSAALLIDKDNREMNATLLYNKATVFAKLNRTREAEQACTLALDLKPDYMKALKRRAQCCTELGESEDAVEDYTKLLELYKQANLAASAIEDIKRSLQTAEHALKNFKRVNYYYRLLGVRNSATTTRSDIRKSYLQRSKLFHPDKLLDKEKCLIERNERRFVRMKKAYEVLSDDANRRSYDIRQPANNDDDDDNSDSD